MARSEAELEAEVERLSALIVTVTTTPKPSYMVDGVMMQWTAYLAMLNTMRSSVMDQLRAVPTVVETQVDFIDE